MFIIIIITIIIKKIKIIICESHRGESSLEAGGAAAHAERAKARKYAHLDHAYRFQPVAFETCGTIGPESLPFLKELGRRLRSATVATWILVRLSHQEIPRPTTLPATAS